MVVSVSHCPGQAGTPRRMRRANALGQALCNGGPPIVTAPPEDSPHLGLGTSHPVVHLPLSEMPHFPDAGYLEAQSGQLGAIPGDKRDFGHQDLRRWGDCHQTRGVGYPRAETVVAADEHTAGVDDHAQSRIQSVAAMDPIPMPQEDVGRDRALRGAGDGGKDPSVQLRRPS